MFVIMENEIKIISVRETHEFARKATEYFSSRWSEVPQDVYRDCITESLYAPGCLPQWYLLLDKDVIIGCCGLVTNDFISRMDLCPWVCALYVEEDRRGRGYAGMLLEHCRRDTETYGFRSLYLYTGLEGFYEKYGYAYIGKGYGPDGVPVHMYRYDISARKITDKYGYAIRPEMVDETDELYSLVRTAFRSAEVSDGTEQDFAAGLRQGTGYIPQLALVAEYSGNPVAHIMFTRTYVAKPDGNYFEGLLVAPLSVLAGHRGKGVGSALIEEGMSRARDMGYGAVFLCGDPAYYHRFGFRSLEHYGIKSAGEVPSQYVMCAELYPGALDGIIGKVEFC